MESFVNSTAGRILLLASLALVTGFAACLILSILSRLLSRARRPPGGLQDEEDDPISRQKPPDPTG